MNNPEKLATLGT